MIAFTEKELTKFALLDWPGVRIKLFSTKGMNAKVARTLVEQVYRGLAAFKRRDAFSTEVKLRALAHVSLIEKWVKRNWVQDQLQRRIASNPELAKLQPRTVKMSLAQEFDRWWQPGSYGSKT